MVETRKHQTEQDQGTDLLLANSLSLFNHPPRRINMQAGAISTRRVCLDRFSARVLSTLSAFKLADFGKRKLCNGKLKHSLIVLIDQSHKQNRCAEGVQDKLEVSEEHVK